MSSSLAGNPADINNDNFVNLIDYSQFLNKWQIEEYLLSEDINRNGIVNMDDLII